MLEEIPGVPEGILAVRVVGKLTADDYAQVVEPALREAHRQKRGLRVLLHLGPQYEGFTAGALWEKTETWLRNRLLWRWIEGYAVVSDIRWVDEFAHLAAFLAPFPMQVFGNDALDDALAWLESLPEGSGATHDPAGATPSAQDRS